MPLSLKARALRALAQREHSRSELRTKLLRHAGTQAGSQPDGAAHADPEQLIDQLLDELESTGLLSDARFTESRIHARAGRFGHALIRQELARHGIALEAQAAQALRQSEFERAMQLWKRKFGALAQDPTEQARQMRFLAGRGFSGDVIVRLVRKGEGID